MTIFRQLLHLFATFPWSDDAWSVNRHHRRQDAMRNLHIP